MADDTLDLSQKLAEKERQQGIMDTRLKNLKKARKAKKKKRGVI